MDSTSGGLKRNRYKPAVKISLKYKMLFMSLMIAAAGWLSYYCHGVMRTCVIYTHLYYIPIVFSAIWWKRKGFIVTVILGVFLIVNHMIFLSEVPLFDDYIRAIMFVVVGFVTVMLSEQIDKAEKITSLKRKKLRFLTQRLCNAEEQHRLHIAAGLHDSVGPKLSAAKILIQTLKNKDPKDIPGHLGKIIDCVDSSIVEIREMIFQLSPKVLYQLGLKAAVESLIESFERETSLKFDYEYEGPSNSLNQKVRSIIFRAVRELVININKHAKAQNVHIKIENDPCLLTVTVEDDGVGFNASEVLNNHDVIKNFGLFSIRQQLLNIDGQLFIESDVGIGSKVTMVCPIIPTEKNIESEWNHADQHTYSGKSYSHV